ncbi:hypothetical protein A2U01_0103993, partial [Trifolium medium]|nr:hypothetical protein [Trifolium medium]
MANQSLSSASRTPISQVDLATQCDVSTGEHETRIVEPEKIPILPGESTTVNPEK